ncbi:MAG TPA: hypothetical protein VNI77_03635 [Nitrososphaera sp.]|nr:hypothetical protein [Nitrososphaera sp.]
MARTAFDVLEPAAGLPQQPRKKEDRQRGERNIFFVCVNLELLITETRKNAGEKDVVELWSSLN